LTSPLPARQSDGHVRSEFHLHFTNKGNEWSIFSNIEHYKVKNGCFHVWNLEPEQSEKVTLKAMDHENITKPMKGIDWRAPSPPVKVMDTSAMSSISISQTKEMNEVFFTSLEHYKVKNGCFHMLDPELEQSESTLEENGSWKYNQSHERKRLTSPLPARQSDGHIESDLSISISPTKEISEVFFFTTLNITRSRMVASTCGILSPSNRKVTLKAMDHENITKPMKGIDWRAPSPLVKVMDTSKVTSPSPFHQQMKRMKYFYLPWISKGQECFLPFVESRARAIGKYPWRQWIMKI